MNGRNLSYLVPSFSNLCEVNPLHWHTHSWWSGSNPWKTAPPKQTACHTTKCTIVRKQNRIVSLWIRYRFRRFHAAANIRCTLQYILSQCKFWTNLTSYYVIFSYFHGYCQAGRDFIGPQVLIRKNLNIIQSYVKTTLWIGWLSHPNIGCITWNYLRLSAAAASCCGRSGFCLSGWISVWMWGTLGSGCDPSLKAVFPHVFHK